MIFIPKKIAPIEGLRLLRAADKMRPLSLKLTSNKLVCSAVNGSMRHRMRTWVHASQRGFTSQRQFMQNILVVDTACRGIACIARPVDIPIFITLDLKAAFPSLSRRWLYKVLSRAKLPLAFRRFVSAIYSSVCTNTTLESLLWRSLASLRFPALGSRSLSKRIKTNQNA